MEEEGANDGSILTAYARDDKAVWKELRENSSAKVIRIAWKELGERRLWANQCDGRNQHSPKNLTPVLFDTQNATLLPDLDRGPL